jgi:hypothetical protein
VISAESRVVVSSLARLERLSQIHGRVAGGLLSASRARRLLQRVEAVLTQAAAARALGFQVLLPR